MKDCIIDNSGIFLILGIVSLFTGFPIISFVFGIIFIQLKRYN